MKEAKQKFVALKKSNQQAEKQRLDDKKKTSSAETNGDINVGEMKVCWYVTTFLVCVSCGMVTASACINQALHCPH